MMTDVPPQDQTRQLLQPYFIFDADLNLIGERDASMWPTAVLIVLRACVRKALAERRSSFRPFGLGAQWHIATFECAGSRRLAVFVDSTGRTEPCC
jgi:hypothetical protein